MLCPACKNVNLLMTDRQGVEIDYCPQCRGVWLDRGELDKIIDRAAQISTIPENRTVDYVMQDQPPPQEYRHHGNRKYHDHNFKKKKRGLLGELFDFD